MPSINENINYPKTGNLVENMTFFGYLLILTSLSLTLRMKKNINNFLIMALCQ